MASAMVLSAPTTPLANTRVIPPSPGTWRHPKFDEITRRQNATNFSDKNIRAITWNGVTLFVTWLLGKMLDSYPYIYDSIFPHDLRGYADYLILSFRFVLVLNITLAFRPLIERKDDLVDIPLTPSQRTLLGLDPNIVSVATPASQYITPPRYPRSATPRSSTPGSRSSSNTESPLSRKGASIYRRQGNDSPFSPSASPSWQKSIGGSRDTLRRHSYGSPSPLGPGFNSKDSSILGAPSTPSPSASRGASVGLNNRWLYERGRASPGNRSLYS